MKALATASKDTGQIDKRKTHSAIFSKVLDGRKQAIRGLWIRNQRYYARLAIEDGNTGFKNVRRVPLVDSDGKAVQTVPQAIAAMGKLKTQRADDDLPQIGLTPIFSAYAANYLEYIKAGDGIKKAGTFAKEKSTLNRWTKHLGGLRIDKIKPVHVSAFVKDRLKDGMSKRTVKLDLIALRNVLKRARDIDRHVKVLPIPEGLNQELKSTPPKRSLMTVSDVDSLCASALAKNEGGKLVTKNGEQFCDYIRLMGYSGARRNETLTLRWTDVDFDREQMTIGTDGDTKNSTSRVVDFNPKLKALLLNMKKRGQGVSQWLFPSPQRGAKDIHAKTFKESLNQARAHAKMLGITFHDLRHHFISYAVMSGIDYMTIAKWVGHRDGGILIGKVYGHLADDHSKAQAQRMNFGPVVLEIAAI